MIYELFIHFSFNWSWTVFLVKFWFISLSLTLLECIQVLWSFKPWLWCWLSMQFYCCLPSIFYTDLWVFIFSLSTFLIWFIMLWCCLCYTGFVFIVWCSFGVKICFLLNVWCSVGDSISYFHCIQCCHWWGVSLPCSECCSFL